MLLFLIWLSVFQVCLSYNSPININTTASATITNFQVDLAACSCDISTACDTFCCCDSKCTSDLITKWTNNNWCADNAVQIQKLCKNLGSKGFSTFQDLGCVMYTNRGAIGMFYSAPNSNSFVDPNIPKFSITNPEAKGKNSITQPTSVKYQQYSPIKLLINSVSNELIVYLSSLDQSCRKSYILLNQGTYTSSCSYPILNSQACTNINKYIIGSTFLFCQFANCSSTVSSSTTVPTVVAGTPNSDGSCGGVVTQVTVQIVMGYQNGEYKILSSSLGFVTATISSSSAIITTKVSITKSGSSSSGNPGYIVGKSLSFSSGRIYQIANPTDKSCLTTSSVNNNNFLPINFGVNQTFTCLTTTPCANSLYIDQIPKANSYKIQKYASQSTQSVNITAPSTFSCSTQSYTLYIIYTYSGWVMDKQNYIIGSKIVAQSSANSVSNIKMKQLNVKWIQVEPNAISTPPTNYFYTYFEYLWTPLSSAFYKTFK